MKKLLNELLRAADPMLDAAGVMDIDRNNVDQVCSVLFNLGDDGNDAATALAVEIAEARVSRDAEAN